MAEALDPPLPPDLDRLAKAVLRAACDRDLKLVSAESCTGGLLASLLTDIPRLSHAFERGFVTYTDAAKRELLDVPQEVLAGAGAVSEPAARAMAEGALARSHGHLAVSITGYTEAAEPGQEAGLVHFGLARSGQPTLHKTMRFGDIGRAAVRLEALRTALQFMQAHLAEVEAVGA